jgi:superfamily II DNA helicase RecQ
MAWVEGHDSKVMFATSAFSTGNDHSHVSLVIHAYNPFNMLEYVQGQGRAGHDPAICHMLVPTRVWKESSKEDNMGRSNDQAILDYLYLYGAKWCLHYETTQYIDGL